MALCLKISLKTVTKVCLSAVSPYKRCLQLMAAHTVLFTRSKLWVVARPAVCCVQLLTVCWQVFSESEMFFGSSRRQLHACLTGLFYQCHQWRRRECLIWWKERLDHYVKMKNMHCSCSFINKIMHTKKKKLLFLIIYERKKKVKETGWLTNTSNTHNDVFD